MATRTRPNPAVAFLEGRNPLEAIVHAAQGVESGRDNLGLVQIRRVYHPSRGLLGFAGRVLGHRYHRRVNLDERGSFLWEQIDGTRSLDALADALARRYEIDPADARKAAVLFVRDLLSRHLVSLSFPAAPPSDEARNG